MIKLLEGDCRDSMRGMAENSIDAIVSDPPYGLGFMGKGWDHGVPGAEFWQEALRVAKPGAYLLAFGGTRTFHRLTVAIEDAGWEIRDCIMWVYGSGFPKSHDVSKGIDKAAGAEREVVGNRRQAVGVFAHSGSGKPQDINAYADNWRITKAATEAAKQWQGWGTALKPAWEPIIVARKPLMGTVAENVGQYGTGGINIDGCRVATKESTKRPDGKAKHGADSHSPALGANWGGDGFSGGHSDGRWPANLIHDGSDDVVSLFPDVDGTFGMKKVEGGHRFIVGDTETVQKFDRGFQDSGSAARFFYCAKANQQDRNEGCENLPPKRDSDRTLEDGVGGDNPRNRSNNARRNHHPCVKPTALMRYLCRLVTPPGGVVLDPFMGSGSTGKGAIAEGFSFIGCELDPEYVEIARARIASVGDVQEDAPEPVKTVEKTGQLSLFGGPK